MRAIVVDDGEATHRVKTGPGGSFLVVLDGHIDARNLSIRRIAR